MGQRAVRRVKSFFVNTLTRAGRGSGRASGVREEGEKEGVELGKWIVGPLRASLRVML
jgi:hypothetical protein